MRRSAPTRRRNSCSSSTARTTCITSKLSRATCMKACVSRYDLLSVPLRWHVADVPETVKRGIERHQQLKSSMISFGTDLVEAPASNIMLMLGVLQYLPDPLGE